MMMQLLSQRSVLRLFFALSLVFCSGIHARSQSSTSEMNLLFRWNPPFSVAPPESAPLLVLGFEGSVTRDGYGLLPFLVQNTDLASEYDKVAEVRIGNPVYEPLPAAISENLINRDRIGLEPVTGHDIMTGRESAYAAVSLLPLRLNPATGLVERLVSATLVVVIAPGNPLPGTKLVQTYADHSVLQSGNWYRFSLGATGIYRLTYEDLSKAGLPVGSIDPRNLRVYGNGGGMLPESNALLRIDDLAENAIYVSGEADGRFDPGDYLLFYGESPDQWFYSSQDHLFHHKKNVYTDVNYYFLNWDKGPGLRITTESSTSQTANNTISKFNAFAFYERDDINLIKSGREWWDHDYFDITTTRNYTFSFPNIDEVVPVTLIASVAARSTAGTTSFSVSAQGKSVMTIPIPATTAQYTDDYAIPKVGSAGFNTTDPVIEVKLVYNKTSNNAIGYLNYLEINAMRHLIMNGSQMEFRSVLGAGQGKVTEFRLTANAGQQITVWDVSNGHDVRQMEPQAEGTLHKFRVPTDTIREFIAFDGSDFLTPTFVGAVANQDLHSAVVVDYIIVSHPSFAHEAERLAAFHRDHSNLSVMVTTPEKIYNEFSSGKQDISAIRDFVRMLYNRANGVNPPRYLLLFGDASYDYKSRIQDNTNYVPAFQSLESLSPIESYATDDFFVLMNDNEGQNCSGTLDLGIGRFPVFNAQQAKEAVDKVIHYCTNSDAVKNDWRNMVTFVGDDQDEGGNLFINDSEDLAAIVETNYKDYNVDKIYSDAYTQISTPGGARYPEVNDVINKRVEKGTLLMNYVGHGGEVGWSHERILEVPDIQAWSNFNNLPVFVTATCEFSRYDDPGRVSAGELVLLNPKGGGIALFTTTRLTFAGTNKVLSVNFYNNAFKKTDGRYYKMGDLIMLSKNLTGSSSATRKFVLLGDPALEMAYPDLQVVTTSVNGQSQSVATDTLKALAEFTIEGEIRDVAGNRMEDFSGTVFPTVYDKASEFYTKGNDGQSPVMFSLRKNVVYKGQVDVVNGVFSFTFIVPKDIAYKYGVGRISYYARNEETDANGYDETIVVGGYNNGAPFDDRGPDIALYMNDRNFVSGGITGQSPVMLADVSDESGVNTVGNGIGHDITAVIDNRTNEPYILNDYYVSDLNKFTSGVISYPLSAQSEGSHQLTLKVWDVYNNSSEASIEFIVVPTAEFAFRHLFNYPNPMRDHTAFSFETNQVSQDLEVELRIYNLFGALLKTIRQTVYAQGYRVEPINWDGTTDQGWKISSGTYVYQMAVMLPDGTTSRLSSKLVVIR
jgi:hypothetical protein